MEATSHHKATAWNRKLTDIREFYPHNARAPGLSAESLYGVRVGSESRRTPMTDVRAAPDVHTAMRPSLVGARTG